MKMKTLATAAMILGTLGLTAGLVTANTAANRGPAPFATWDADGNGTVDEQEFNTMREQRQSEMKSRGRVGRNMANAPAFAQIDTDGDGLITADELTAVQQNRGSRTGMGNHHGRGQGKMQGQACINNGMGCGQHGKGQAMTGTMGQRYQAMNAETREKYDAFFAATTELRKEMMVKRAEKQAVMRSTNPDPDQAAQLTRELLELRGQMMARAEEAGVSIGPGAGHGGARW